MASSVTDANPQKDGNRGNDKTNDMIVLMEDRLAKFTNTMSALRGRVKDMEKSIEEPESTGDMD